jgi:eukaryotic-like serine/threonine-protein kinase
MAPSDQDWENLKEIFHAAVALAPDERPGYLDRACDGDVSLRQAVESLLKSHEESGNFVDNPAYQAASEMLIDAVELRAGEILGHYRIASLLGEGGMGKVYLAEDTKLHRKVSLKFLSKNFAQDRERMRRFEQEARAASALNHPNILTIHEIGEAAGHHFIATEFIEGQTLRERLPSGLDIDDALDIAIQVSAALVAAHRVKIVHRDIKPENIMIRKDDGLVKVLDFGLAKMTARRQDIAAASGIDTALVANTGPGVVMGTLAYMSPEQARGEAVDERTDIWSLGVVLYEMIAGCSPFVAGTSNEIISAILSKQAPPPLIRYASEVPERLEEIVEKALTKNRDERYQTSKDLLIDLNRLKRSLEHKAGVERITARDNSGVPASAGSIGAIRTPPEGVVRSASSAEYIVNQVKSHKRGAVLTLVTVVLAITTAVLVYAWRARQTTTTVSQPEIKSLAVLPLKSLDAGENYLGLGIADAVIRRISQTGQVIVRPMSAVRRYSNEETDALSAAKQLGVDSVLEGTVQRADDRLRVSVNLLRTSDGSSLWADSFDMRVADIFTIQDTVAQQVASRLQLNLDPTQRMRLGKRYTSNPEAYEYFTKGRTSFEQVSTSIGDYQPTEAAIGYFRKAVELDPKFALAYAALGEAYMWMANFTDPDNSVWVGQAEQALAHAESLDPQLAEIHSVRFEYYFSKYGDWDLARAAREARQALALNPSVGHLALGTIYDHLGLDEAIGLREHQRALEIDPSNTGTQWRLVQSYSLYGKFDEAIELHLRFFGSPGDVDALIGKGRLDEARTLLEESVKKTPGDLWSRSRLALISALKGDSKEAESALPTIVEQARNNRAYHHITYNIACVYALAGKTDEAVKWLRITAETGMPNYPRFARDPHLDRIRKEPAFIQFMTELKKRWDGYQREFGT